MTMDSESGAPVGINPSSKAWTDSMVFNENRESSNALLEQTYEEPKLNKTSSPKVERRQGSIQGGESREKSHSEGGSTQYEFINRKSKEIISERGDESKCDDNTTNKINEDSMDEFSETQDFDRSNKLAFALEKIKNSMDHSMRSSTMTIGNETENRSSSQDGSTKSFKESQSTN